MLTSKSDQKQEQTTASTSLTRMLMCGTPFTSRPKFNHLHLSIPISSQQKKPQPQPQPPHRLPKRQPQPPHRPPKPQPQQHRKILSAIQLQSSTSKWAEKTIQTAGDRQWDSPQATSTVTALLNLRA